MNIKIDHNETIQQKLARLRAHNTVTPAVTNTLDQVQKEVLSAPAPKPLTPIQQRIMELMAAKKAKEAGIIQPLVTITEVMSEVVGKMEVTTVSNALNTLVNNSTVTGVDKTGAVIHYNKEQLEFINTASAGIDCILIGAAGTGKTTCMRGAVSGLIDSGIVPAVCEMDGHKYLPPKTNGIVLVSFTRRAVSNLRKAMSEELKPNCLTIHSLLEYEPVYYDVLDPETGENKSTMRFEPTRHAMRPLPSGIRTCVIDESSMVSVELFAELQAALPSNCQFIFLGDIQQLPPVFGAAILGYKMLELKTVELVEVYRQALESPIIRLAHRILSGKPIPQAEFLDWKYPNQLTIHPWKKKLDNDLALLTLAKFLTVAIDSGMYNPDEDMILIPFNKACGTIELNKHVANHIARKNKRITYEVIAGFNRLYVSVGDKVLYDKEDAIITDIQINPSYTGALPQPASDTLDYWGCNQTTEEGSEHHISTEENSEAEIDLLLSMAAATTDEDRVRKASHIVTVKLLDSQRELKVDSAANLNSLLLSYALTVHKSQGSEFRKVFFLIHQSHNTMLQRELMYTAVTRAREELYIICEPESLMKGITSQRIKGNTLAEKAEYFKGKLDSKL